MGHDRNGDSAGRVGEEKLLKIPSLEGWPSDLWSVAGLGSPRPPETHPAATRHPSQERGDELIMHNAFLIGTRIYLRPLELEDIPTLAKWLARSEVQTALDLFYRLPDRSAKEVFLEYVKTDENDVALGIMEKATDTLQGFIGLNRIDSKNSHVQLGFFIGGQSPNTEEYEAEAVHLIAKYAFETLNMNRIWLHVDASDNHAIQRLEKAGFSHQATLCQDRYSEGGYLDTVVMGMLRGSVGRAE